MAKNAKNGKKKSEVATNGDATVVGVEAVFSYSVRLYLSTDASIDLTCSGADAAACQANRDIVVAALTGLLQTAAVPKAG